MVASVNQKLCLANILLMRKTICHHLPHQVVCIHQKSAIEGYARIAKQLKVLALLLLASLQTMATPAGVAATSSSQGVATVPEEAGFIELPDDLLNLLLQRCSAKAQKTLGAVTKNCAKIHREMTEKRSIIIDMHTVSRLIQQGRSLSELHVLLSQAHAIKIRNIVAADFLALLPHMVQVRQLKVQIVLPESGNHRLQILQAIAQSPQIAKLKKLDLLWN